jgi:hypothetical protein
VSELLYNGATLEQIAGYDDEFIEQVLWRKRDSRGRLDRYDLPEGCEVDDDGMRVISSPVAFGAMFREVKKFQGLDEDDAEKRWQEYLDENPRLRSYGVA